MNDVTADSAGDVELQRLKWRSRRGALELELVLAPFVRTRLAGLDASGRRLYARLLEHDDWDIFEWIQGRAVPPDPQLEPLIDQIRSANRPSA
ncbi:MAG: succinate dehydrogenase assembly factor 2 [Pseudomonadales bacterium]